MLKTLTDPAVEAQLLIDALPDTVRPLAQRGSIQHFKPGTRIVEEGDLGNALYVLLKGRVRAYSIDPSEREITYCIDTAGECFGEMALDGGPRSASVEALDDTLCSVVTRVSVMRHISEHPAFGIELLMRVIGRARDATERARRLALMDVYSRLSRLLEELAVTGADGVRQVGETLTHQAIAARVGSSREMVSRLMKDLERGGYVRTEDRRISLLKPLPARW